MRQRGPRRLWDEVRAAHTWWTEQGRPDEQDWVFTRTATQKHLTLKRKARRELDATDITGLRNVRGVEFTASTGGVMGATGRASAG